MHTVEQYLSDHINSRTFTNEEELKSVLKSIERFIIKRQFKLTRNALKRFRQKKTKASYQEIFYWYNWEFQKYADIIEEVYKLLDLTPIASPLLSGEVTYYYKGFELEYKRPKLFIIFDEED